MKLNDNSNHVEFYQTETIAAFELAIRAVTEKLDQFGIVVEDHQSSSGFNTKDGTYTWIIVSIRVKYRR